ncbi:MAG: hypothetical protein CSA50_05905 [Gammaproteobacteria bacterium]|nr:MAG: hypothetical protein CSA50_05905 [Gammaproteobacteria bacterium]
MSFYLSQFIIYFLLPAFLSGLIFTQIKPRSYQTQIIVSLLGIFAGSAFFLLLPWRQKWILLISSIALMTYSIVATYGVWTLFTRKSEESLDRLYASKGFFVFIHAIILLIFFCASYFWTRTSQLSMLSSTSVINTEMVLNALMPILGFILVLLVSFSLQSVFKLSKVSRYLLIIGFACVAMLPLSGEWMLVMIKLNTHLLAVLDLSYIAKVNYYIWAYPYLVLLCFCGLLGYFWKMQVQPAFITTCAATDAIEKRLALATQQTLQGRFKRLLTLSVALFAILLWWDLVASKPVERSPATAVKLGADRAVHLSFEEHQFEDGELHRFSWVSSDGKQVRFFIIRSNPDQTKYGVVFDACMLCGDAGYAKEGNNVICLACGVHIFIPSIGRKGGCNPIPITAWEQTDKEFIISEKALEEGLRYFDDIVSIEVTDPINGETLINTEAKYQYQYGTKAYFFTTKASYETFRNDPLAYIEE